MNGLTWTNPAGRAHRVSHWYLNILQIQRHCNCMHSTFSVGHCAKLPKTLTGSKLYARSTFNTMTACIAHLWCMQFMISSIINRLNCLSQMTGLCGDVSCGCAHVSRPNTKTLPKSHLAEYDITSKSQGSDTNPALLDSPAITP